MFADTIARETTDHYLLGARLGEDSAAGDWRRPLQAGRLLVISPFEKRPRRPTTESSYQRNELVSALSDEISIVHAEPGGSIERLYELIDCWGFSDEDGDKPQQDTTDGPA